MTDVTCSRCGGSCRTDIPYNGGLTFGTISYYIVDNQYLCHACYQSHLKVKLGGTLWETSWPSQQQIRSWVCPKCGRVWTDQVMGCMPCNNKVLQEEGKNK